MNEIQRQNIHIESYESSSKELLFLTIRLYSILLLFGGIHRAVKLPSLSALKGLTCNNIDIHPTQYVLHIVMKIRISAAY